MPFIPDSSLQKKSTFIPDSSVGQVQPAPEKEGFLKTLGREIATPFGQVAVAGRNLVGGISQLAQGNVAEANRELSSTRTLPFLGETKPFVTGQESTSQAFKKIAGTGADIASNFIAGGAIKNLATLPLRTAVKASAIQGFKEGSVAGGLALGGKAAREDKKADEVIGDAILGILAGGVGGAVLGGAFTGAKRGLAPIARGTSKLGQVVSDKAGKVVEKQVSRFAEQYPKQVARLKVYRGQAQATPELIKQELADLTKTLVDIAQEREGTRKALDKVMRERGFNPLEEVGIQGLVPEFDFSKGRATLDYSLGRDRLKKLIGDGVDVVTREMERLDELGQNVAGRTGETINQFARRVVNNLRKSDLTAGDEKLLVNKVKKELGAIQEKYGNRLSLSQINDFRRQYNRGYSGEDRLLPDLDYAFASAAREAIDDLAQSDIVRRINGQIGRWIEAERFIGRYLDGKNVGSGRFGLWLGRLIGSNIGNNEISRLIGTLGGDQVVKLIQRLQFSSPIRRKILEGLVQDEALLRELLETSSERSRNYILEQVKKAPRLLPEPPQGTPQQQNFVPIRLPERTQSTIDAASQRNISRSTTIPQNTPNAATNQPATASIAQTNNPPTTNLRNVSIPKAVSQATQSVKQDSVGAAAGFSLDEEGNPTFNPGMALAGVLGVGALRKVGSKAVSQADDALLQEARKYKSAEEFVKAQGTPVYHGTDSSSFKPHEFDITKAQKGESFFNPLGEGLYASTNKDFVKRFGKNTEEFIIPANAKIKEISIDTWEKDFPSISQKSLKNLGIKYDDLTFGEKLEINRLVPNSPIESSNNFEVLLRDITDRLNKEGSVQGAIQKAVMDKYKNYDVLKYLDTDHAFAADEIVIKNPAILKTKSQLEDIWRQAKQTALKDNIAKTVADVVSGKLNKAQFISKLVKEYSNKPKVLVEDVLDRAFVLSEQSGKIRKGIEKEIKDFIRSEISKI